MNKLSIFGLVVIMSLGMASCGNSQSQKGAEAATLSAPGKSTGSIVKNLSPAQFQETMNQLSNEVILDVRTPQEVAQGGIPGHISMNFYDPNFKEELKTLDKNAPIMVYCRSGGRSGNTVQQLKALGFKEIYNLSGGMMAWQSQGLPTE